MNILSTESICAITGSHPACLERWSKAGLISLHDTNTGWQIEHVDAIYHVATMSASGATLAEIRLWQTEGNHSYTHGWPAYRGEILWQLEYGSNRMLARAMRRIDHDYCGDDYINRVLRPLNNWLRDDMRAGAARRLTRFHNAVLHRAKCAIRHADRNKLVPLFLEAVTVSDETDIWLEAIRLARQGFDVEVSSQVSDTLGVSSRMVEHHLLWCNAGISRAKHRAFREKLDAGQPIRLCGPDIGIAI